MGVLDDKPLDAGVLQQALDKWLPIVGLVEELGRKVDGGCSFCTYYGQCGRGCPLSKDVTGERNCDPFFKLQAALDDCSGYVDDIVGVIQESDHDRLALLNAEEAKKVRLADYKLRAEKEEVRVCGHVDDVEVTVSGDDKRYFLCAQCGRHRSEFF